MASFYSDAFLYKQPLSTHSTTLSCPKIRLPRRGKKRLSVVRLGTQQRPRQGRRFSLSRIFRRVRLRWLRLQYSCMLRRLKQYYKSLIKDIVQGGASSIEVYHQQRVLMESSMGMAMHPALGPSFSHFRGGAATLSAPS